MAAERKNTLPTHRAGPKSSVREAMRRDYPEPGTLIDGTYRVLEQLGEGGMGVVLHACDERLARDVAIKLIHPEQHLLTTSRAQFLDEARAMARIRHPNVVEIYSFGHIGRAPYFVMEYVPGSDLERFLAKRGGPPSLSEAWNILDQACRGVAAIHDTGHAHRDLKAGNILVGPEFRVAITDLGLARVVEEQREQTFVSGTPAYMAPELITGAKIAKEHVPSIDVYALGVIAFQVLTGRLPFETKSLADLMTMQLEDPPPRLDSFRQDIPEGFETAIRRALEKKPDKRTHSVEALRRQLERAWTSNRAPAQNLYFLVADDDDDFRPLIAMTLQRAFPEARIECVENGEAALTACRRETPDLLISDLDMPEMNGIELTAALREDESTRQLPIVVATGVGGPSDWRVLSRLGADSFMIKPFDAIQLISIAENLIARETAWKPKKRREL
jgi:serine/threonine-protein kinase